MKEYLIPAGYGEAEFVEKRSRFIGRVWHTETEERALACLKELREKHWDATHNVYAYIIRDTGVMRYSDDGEPQGTSGIPTLSVFQNEQITNVCCVITRYFGGTLLGAGGLVRAYSHTAKLALDAAGISVVRLWKQMLLSCTYSQYERLKKEIEAFQAVIESTDFGADVVMELLVPEQTVEAFTAHMVDVSAGTVLLEEVGEQKLPVQIK